jgi:hypothetical protein
MRRYIRIDLPDDVVEYLRRKRAEVDGGKNARVIWEHAPDRDNMLSERKLAA